MWVNAKLILTWMTPSTSLYKLFVCTKISTLCANIGFAMDCFFHHWSNLDIPTLTSSAEINQYVHMTEPEHVRFVCSCITNLNNSWDVDTYWNMVSWRTPQKYVSSHLFGACHKWFDCYLHIQASCFAKSMGLYWIKGEMRKKHKSMRHKWRGPTTKPGSKKTGF